MKLNFKYRPNEFRLLESEKWQRSNANEDTTNRTKEKENEMNETEKRSRDLHIVAYRPMANDINGQLLLTSIACRKHFSKVFYTRKQREKLNKKKKWKIIEQTNIDFYSWSNFRISFICILIKVMLMHACALAPCVDSRDFSEHSEYAKTRKYNLSHLFYFGFCFRLFHSSSYQLSLNFEMCDDISFIHCKVEHSNCH